MKAMVLERLGTVVQGATPLRWTEMARPDPGEGEVLVRVHACGVCHTELDEIEGRTPPPVLPVVLGHQVVGRIAEVGPAMTFLSPQTSSIRPHSSRMCSTAT